VAGIAIPVLVLREAPSDAEADAPVVAAESAPHHFALGPRPWPGEASRSAVIELREDGPHLQVTPEVWMALAPSADGLDLTWSTERSDDATEIIGEGEWRGHPTRATWTLADGNPQAAFEIDVEGVSASELEQPFAFEWSLPSGDIRHIDDEMRTTPWVGKLVTLNGWTPTWVEWRGAQQVVSFQQGIYDRLEIAPLEPAGSSIRVVLASDATRPRMAECAPERTLGVGGRIALTLGSGTPVVPSRWVSGAEAVIAAVFEEPANHPDPLAAAGHPMDSGDAARRVRTLALGHSNEADPRHGNGGVLGLGLGATIALPRELDATDSKALRESFASARLELAGDDSAVRLTNGECEAIAAALDDAPEAVVAGYRSYDGSFSNSIKAPDFSVGTDSTLVTLSQLDGRRTSVTDQALGKLYIDRLLRERGGLFLSAPLVASRNPLIPAGKDGLLAPEREGHWTIAEDLVYTFADLELRTETEPFVMAGLAETVGHWRRMRRAELWWGPEGLLLYNPGDEPLEGATIVAAGTLDVDGAFVAGRDIRDAKSDAQTWAWGTLPPSELVTLGFGESYRAPDAVEWIVKTASE
jgi:hypothetical protein